MTTPLDIIISRTLTVPPATAMFAYRDNVADVDTGGEYAFAAPTVYLALTDSDGKTLPTLPVGTTLMSVGRNPFN